MKKVIALLLVAVMMLTAVACGSTTTDTASTSDATPASTAESTGTETVAPAADSVGAETAAETGDTSATGWQNVVYGTEVGVGNINSVDYNTTATSSKDTLIVQIPTDPGTFDLGTQITASYTMSWMFNKLLTYRYDETGSIVACCGPESLATDYVMDDDGLGVTFTLRQGVKFSNGYDFTAKDVKFSFEHASSMSQIGIVDIENIEIIDDYTIYVPLFRVDANAAFDVGGIIPIFSAQLWDEIGGEENDAEFTSTNAVGTGPYMLESWNPGDCIKLVANPNYFNGEPLIKYVELRVIADNAVAFMALQNGEIDMMTETSCQWADIQTVVNGQTEGISDYVEFSTQTHTLIENCTEGMPLSDLNVRKAIAYAIDRDLIAAYVYEGTGYVTDSVVSLASPGTKEYDPWPYSYNPDKAKECLEAAGYEPGELNLSIVIGAGDTTRGNVAELMIGTFAECGINLTIDYTDIAAVADKLVNQTTAWDLALKGVSNGDFQEPYAATFFSDTGILSVQAHPQQDAGYAKMVELSTAMNNATTDEERNEIWSELQDYYLENCMYSYKIVTTVAHTLYNSSLKNFSRTSYYNLDVAHAYFE